MPIVAHLKRNLLIFPISVLFEAVLKDLLFISRDTRKEHETARARRSRVLVIKLAVKFHLQLRAFSKLLKVSLSFLSLRRTKFYFHAPYLYTTPLSCLSFAFFLAPSVCRKTDIIRCEKRDVTENGTPRRRLLFFLFRHRERERDRRQSLIGKVSLWYT